MSSLTPSDSASASGPQPFTGPVSAMDVSGLTMSVADFERFAAAYGMAEAREMRALVREQLKFASFWLSENKRETRSVVGSTISSSSASIKSVAPVLRAASVVDKLRSLPSWRPKKQVPDGLCYLKTLNATSGPSLGESLSDWPQFRRLVSSPARCFESVEVLDRFRLEPVGSGKWHVAAGGSNGVSFLDAAALCAGDCDVGTLGAVARAYGYGGAALSTPVFGSDVVGGSPVCGGAGPPGLARVTGAGFMADGGQDAVQVYAAKDRGDIGYSAFCGRESVRFMGPLYVVSGTDAGRDGVTATLVEKESSAASPVTYRCRVHLTPGKRVLACGREGTLYYFDKKAFVYGGAVEGSTVFSRGEVLTVDVKEEMDVDVYTMERSVWGGNGPVGGTSFEFPPLQ